MERVGRSLVAFNHVVVAFNHGAAAFNERAIAFSGEPTGARFAPPGSGARARRFPRPRAEMTRWAVLTGEYPPQFGGVADSTRQVAVGLAAAGDAVTVHAPRCAGAAPEDHGVTVVRLPDHFGSYGLLWLDHALAKSRPDHILIQYVPRAFGYKTMNVPFAVWVAARARRGAPVWAMFHEVSYPFAWRSARGSCVCTRGDGAARCRCRGTRLRVGSGLAAAVTKNLPAGEAGRMAPDPE